MKLRAINKEKELPKRDDLIILNQYLIAESEALCGKEIMEHGDWHSLASTLLVQLCIFNKRRISEVEEITVQDILTLSMVR